MAHTYDDPVKALSREKLRDWIRQRLAMKRPRDLRVLCFPGAEQEGQEALEVKEVYDPLGIPRKNIVGLEQDRQKAERLRTANLGIEVVNASDIDYFSQCGRKFDIISLDYTGQRGRETIDAIALIASRQRFTSWSILCTNHYAKQEPKTRQQFLESLALLNTPLDARTIAEISSTDNPRFAYIMHRMETLKDSHVPLAEARDLFTHEVIRVLSYGEEASDKVAGERNDFLFWYPGAQEQRKTLREICKSDVIAVDLEHAWHLDHFRRYVAPYFGRSPEEPQSHLLMDVLRMAFIHSYMAQSIARYGYQSNSGAKMEMDIFEVKTLDRLFDRIRHMLHCVETPEGKILTIDTKTDPRKLQNGINAMADEIRKWSHVYWLGTLPKREYLGSSYHPQRGHSESTHDA